MADLTRLLDPASVAFIGGERAAFAIEQSRLLGYEGTMLAVNPTRPGLAGVPTVATVADLPTVPDAAFVAVDRVRSIEVVAALRELGCGGVVCYASGYAESGPEGAELQARLVEAAGDMPMIGPNCHGYVNALSGAVLWPDVQGCRRIERGVAIVTQSGNLAINITMQQRGLPLAQVITLGNQAGVGIEDCIEALVSDDRITAIGLHIEALSDPGRFAASAVQAHRMGKPIVALKTGLTDAGAAIARTHTASLAGSAAAYQALFERVGVVQVESLPVMLGALAVLGTHGRLGGNRLTSLSCSGGEAGLIADRAAGLDVAFPAFDAAAASRIADTLDNRVPITNPLDYHTFIWGDLAKMTACFTETLSGGVDAGILVIDFPVPGADDTWWWPTLEAFVAAHIASGTPAVVTATLPENLPARVATWLADRGIPAVPGIDDALRSLEAAARPAPAAPSVPAPCPPEAGRAVTLGEHQAKVRLGEVGVTVPESRIAPRSGLAAAAEAIGYPVVLKAIGLEHKTEAGGVVVGIGGPDDLARAAESMAALGSEFMVESFAAGAVAELVVGVRREPPVGWTVTIGSGGVLVELLADAVTLLAPVSHDDVQAALQRLRVWPLLAGHRSRAGGDADATVEAIVRIAELAVAERFVEFEVNPLLVMQHGAVAVDALGVAEA